MKSVRKRARTTHIEREWMIGCRDFVYAAIVRNIAFFSSSCVCFFLSFYFIIHTQNVTNKCKKGRKGRENGNKWKMGKKTHTNEITITTTLNTPFTCTNKTRKPFCITIPNQQEMRQACTCEHNVYTVVRIHLRYIYYIYTYTYNIFLKRPVTTTTTTTTMRACFQLYIPTIEVKLLLTRCGLASTLLKYIWFDFIKFNSILWTHTHTHHTYYFNCSKRPAPNEQQVNMWAHYLLVYSAHNSTMITISCSRKRTKPIQ